MGDWSLHCTCVCRFWGGWHCEFLGRQKDQGDRGHTPGFIVGVGLRLLQSVLNYCIHLCHFDLQASNMLLGVDTEPIALFAVDLVTEQYTNDECLPLFSTKIAVHGLRCSV